MFNEEVFKFDIDNIKNDLAIEGMEITNADVDIYRRFANDELNMPQLIEIIKIKVYKIKITQKLPINKRQFLIVKSVERKIMRDIYETYNSKYCYPGTTVLKIN